MKDSEIIEIILDCCKRFREDYDGWWVEEDVASPSDFGADWNGLNNRWGWDTAVDPLSAVLIMKNPEPFRQGDDNLAIATLANVFEKSSGWVRSFQYSMSGQKNAGNSISGYVVGAEVRKQILCLGLSKKLTLSLVG